MGLTLVGMLAGGNQLASKCAKRKVELCSFTAKCTSKKAAPTQRQTVKMNTKPPCKAAKMLCTQIKDLDEKDKKLIATRFLINHRINMRTDADKFNEFRKKIEEEQNYETLVDYLVRFRMADRNRAEMCTAACDGKCTKRK